MALKFEKQVDGTNLEVSLTGRLDTNTSPQFESFLKENLANKTQVELDFEKLEYISSAGLRVILSVQKIMNKQGAMKLVHVNKLIREIFEATGLNDILTIEE